MAIKFYTHVGDTVLDPFTGSSTTNLAALKLDRNSIGIDINKKFIKLGLKRLINNNVKGHKIESYF